MRARAMLVLVLAGGAACVRGELRQGPRPDYAQDPRLKRLERFLARHGSPASGAAADFLWAADLHGLDWRLLPSIALVETGAGRTARGHNLFGWESGRKRFRSVRQAIYWVAGRLAGSPLYRGKHTQQLLRIYNPLPGYAARVVAVMRRLDPGESPPAHPSKS